MPSVSRSRDRRSLWKEASAVLARGLVRIQCQARARWPARAHFSTPGRLTWFDRCGTPLDSAGPLGDYTDFRLSSDQTRLAASLADPKTGFPDIWITDRARGSSAPFTFGPAVNATPVWAPDGERIIIPDNQGRWDD